MDSVGEEQLIEGRWMDMFEAPLYDQLSSYRSTRTTFPAEAIQPTPRAPGAVQVRLQGEKKARGRRVRQGQASVQCWLGEKVMVTQSD